MKIFINRFYLILLNSKILFDVIGAKKMVGNKQVLDKFKLEQKLKYLTFSKVREYSGHLYVTSDSEQSLANKIHMSEHGTPVIVRAQARAPVRRRLS